MAQSILLPAGVLLIGLVAVLFLRRPKLTASTKAWDAAQAESSAPAASAAQADSSAPAAGEGAPATAG